MTSFWDFCWFIISFFLLIAYLVVLFHIVGDLIGDREVSGGVKAVWILVLIIFPIVTSLAYLVARGHSMAERNRAAARTAQSDTETYSRQVSAGAGSPSDEISRAKALA